MRRIFSMRKSAVLILMSLVGIPLAAMAVASEISGGPTSSVQSVDGYEGTIPDDIGSLSSLCGGLDGAIKSRSGVGALLLARGLVDTIPVSAATQLGTIGTIHCYSDDIEGKIVIMLLNESRDTSVAISNDQLWAASIKMGTDDFGNVIFSHAHEYDITPRTDTSGETIRIDDLMLDTSEDDLILDTSE